MNSNRPVVNAHRKKVVKNIGTDTLRPHRRHGETLIPVGTKDANIELPKTEDTFTYEVINSDAMDGDINISVDNGDLKGLVLNTNRGNLRIDPIASGTKSVTLGNQMKDGSHMNMLSDGSDWFIWSYGIGNGFASSTIGRRRNNQNNPPNSTTTGPTYAPVVIDTITTTADYPSGPAENDLTFNGAAEPNATLKVFDSTDTQVGTVTVGADGSWTWEVYDLANGEHSYTFRAFVGGVSINEASTWTDTVDGGSVTFDCSLIEVEVGTAAPDFVSLPTILAPDGTTTITPTVNSTTYSDSLAEDATFTVTFDYSYLTNSYQRTVNGVVVNRVNPAIPTITTVGGETSGVAINTTTVDIVGTALPNAVVEVYIDGQTSSFASTTADGAGEWTVSSHDFGWTASQTVIIKAQQQTVNGSLWSNPSNDFTVNYELQTLSAPTIEFNGFANNAFTNQLSPFAVQGTGPDGATIVLNGATDNNPPTVVAGGTWSTAVNLSNDVTHTITAQATAVAGYGDSQQSNAFTLNVDRTSPSIATVSDETLYLGNVSDTLPTATDSFTAVGNTVTVTSDTTVDNNLAEGDHTITYTATDSAGNEATSSRTITVTTQVIVPTNLVAIGGTEEATITGGVNGTYSNNLQVKIYVIDSNGLESVYQENGSDVLFSVTNGSFSATLALDAGDYTFSATTVNSIPEESAPSSETSQVTVAGSSAPSATFPTLPSGGTATVDSEGVLAIPADNTVNLTITTDELYGETNPAFNNQIGFSFWFKWDGASPMSFNLFNCGNNKDQSIGVDSSGKISIQKFSSTSAVDLSEILNSTFGIDLYDGQWHHIYIGYSNNQSQTLAQNAGEYHVIVDATFESVGVAIQDYVNSEGLPVTRNLGPSNITIASTHGAAVSLHAIESIIDTPLSLKQVEWLYNSGNGRGVRSLEEASLQNTEDIPSSGLFMKSSLKTSAGVDSTSLTNVDPFAFEGSLDVLDAAFIPFTKFNFPEKAFSFWAKITERNQVIVELIQGREGNDTVWQKFKMSYSASDVLNVVFSRKSERFGSTNQVSGQDTTASIDFSLDSLVDDSYHHFLVSFDSNGSTGNMRTFVDGSLVDTTSYSSTNANMRVDLQDDPYIQLNYEVRMTDVEVWLGEFDQTSVATIYSQGTGFVSEPQFNEWKDFAGGGLVRVGASGLDRVTGNNTNYANYGASWNQDIVVPTGLAEGDYFYVQAELRFLGAHNGYMMFYDPTIASRTGTDFTRDSGGIVSWLFAFNSYINYSNSNSHKWILKALNQNSTSQVSGYTSGRISTNNESSAGAPHRHLRDYEIRFTKEAGGTYAISMEVTSQFDGSVINLNGPTGVTLPSIMRMDVKGSQGDLGYNRANGSIEIESVNMNVTQVP